MIQTSEQINEIAAALAKAQAGIENVEKTGANPAFKREGQPTRYATLGGALEEVRPKLAAEGVAVIQMPVNGEGSNIGVVTRLTHSSGQWIQSALFVAPMKFDAQSAGSVITYLRRYALMAMVGLAPEDDDGNAAVAKPEVPRQSAGMVRAADVPRDDGNRSGTIKQNGNGAVLPVSPEEPPEMRLKRAVGRIAEGIQTAPNDHVCDLVMEDARDILAEIEKVEEPIFKFKDGFVAGIDAAKRLRTRHNQRIAELRSGK